MTLINGTVEHAMIFFACYIAAVLLAEEDTLLWSVLCFVIVILLRAMTR